MEPIVGKPECTDMMSFDVVNPETLESTEVMIQIDFENVFIEGRETIGHRLKGEIA